MQLKLTHSLRHCWAIHWAADDGVSLSDATATAAVESAVAASGDGDDAERRYSMTKLTSDSSSDSADCDCDLTADESWESSAPVDWAMLSMDSSKSVTEAMTVDGGTMQVRRAISMVSDPSFLSKSLRFTRKKFVVQKRRWCY